MMGVLIVSPSQGTVPRKLTLSYVSLVRATYCTIHAVIGRPVQTGQVLFEFKFTTAQSDMFIQISNYVKDTLNYRQWETFMRHYW